MLTSTLKTTGCPTKTQTQHPYWGTLWINHESPRLVRQNTVLLYYYTVQHRTHKCSQHASAYEKIINLTKIWCYNIREKVGLHEHSGYKLNYKHLVNSFQRCLKATLNHLQNGNEGSIIRWVLGDGRGLCRGWLEVWPCAGADWRCDPVTGLIGGVTLWRGWLEVWPCAGADWS